MQTTTASDDDDAWIAEARQQMRANGVEFRITQSRLTVGPVMCEIIINGTVYSVESGATEKEALATAITRAVAARLQGLKF